MTDQLLNGTITGFPVLLLRFSGPLQAFGEPLVDQYNRVGDFPGLAMLTGLLANALGWEHGDFDRLNQLQASLRYAALRDRAGDEIIDYQTVDFSQPSFVDTGWTTRHRPDERGKGEATSGTHIRYRYYRADARCYVALMLESQESNTTSLPTIDEIAQALRYPARPLFLGRKTCLPSSPMFLAKVNVGRLVDGLAMAVNIAERKRTEGEPGLASDADRQVMVPDEPKAEESARFHMAIRVDGRDWRHQQHMGERRVWIGRWV